MQGNKTRLSKIFLTAILSVSVLATYVIAEGNLKTVRAVKTKTPVVDGIFNDPEWNYGGIATDFTQLEPEEGVPASEKTEAYFMFDTENLYIGVKCFDSEPEKVMSELSSRDNHGASDIIFIAFDTYNDDRNGYFFGTTPAGVQLDGRVFNDGQTDDSWDGVWYVEAQKTDFGWTAEFQIPLNTVTFPEEENMTWGLNILRRVERKKEESFWQEVTRDDGFKVSKFGNLEGITGIKPGMNLQLLPYVTSGLKKERDTDYSFNNPNGFTGFDVRYGITSNLTAVLTYNPDFAQIEADEDQINLGRYPLILREKRPFFLEGASIFNTAGNSMSDGHYRTALFYSRRINEPVYGLKTTGKIGSWDVGVIHALNDNDAGINAKVEDEELPENTETQAYYNVVRMSHDILSRSQIGLVAMSKEYSGMYTRVFGVDGKLRFDNNYTVSFEGVKSFTKDYDRNNHSMNLYLSHHSDFFKFSLWYQEQAPNFMGDDIGFYDYNNFRNSGFWMQVAPRIEEMGIRRMGINLNAWGENFQDKNYFAPSTLSKGGNMNFWAQTNNYWMFGAGKSLGENYDRYDERFYPSNSLWVWFRNDWSKPFNFRVNHSQGKYRTGYRWSYSGSIRVKPSNRFNIELSHNRSSVRNIFDVDEGEYYDEDYQIYLSKFYYNFTRNLNARMIVQYNGLEKSLDTYYLLGYNFQPGSFLYVAYSERFDKDVYENDAGVEITPRKFGTSYRVLQIKLSYLFQG